MNTLVNQQQDRQPNRYEFTKAEIDRSIPDRFELVVKTYPQRLAVKTETEQLTYTQLNQAANRLARSILARRGEGAELIPILVEHGAMMVVAMLGVLKAGKSWVPIDPWYPPARISYILQTCQATAIVTTEQHHTLAAAVLIDECQIISLDRLDLSLSPENLDLEIAPAPIACILPTSGSTGTPKGVVHNHRNLLHACWRWTNAFGIGVADRSLLVNSYCHIGGINNIFSAVLNGATIYPVNLKQIGLAQLADWIMAEEITLYQSVSTVFRHFIDSLEPKHQFPKLRLIHLGGESVFKQDFELFKQHFDVDCIFLNSFGCTEISSYRQYFIGHQTPMTSNVIPIGYAAEDIEVLLVDQNGVPVGENQIGEIVVQSEYLALGYWQRPDLDAVSFLPDPTGGKQRRYRTGDLGKMLPDGCLIHLGRKDDQIKIRGYRVELSECEAALSEHPGIKEVAVIARYSSADLDRTQSLIGYVVPHLGDNLSSNILLAFLQQKLPSYLIPAELIFLDALPVNANGKIDRLSLPLPQVTDVQSSVYMTPRTPLEQQLVKIWSEVLKRKRVGICDNFFALGGHSLLATQLAIAIESNLGITISPQQLWQTPTIAELAEILPHQSIDLPAIPRRTNSPTIELSFAQQRLWFLEQLAPDRADYHLYQTWRLNGSLNLTALQQSLDAIVAQHEILRTNYISDRDRPLQVIRSPRSVELLLLDLQSYPQPKRDLEIEFRLQQEYLRTFDLEHDLMLRGCVVQVGAQEQILLLVLHHIAFDGWSMGILTAELQSVYAAFSAYKSPQLPVLPIQYADFALWQRQYLQGEVLAANLDYWQQQMAGAPGLLSLPTDRPRPAVQTFRGGSVAFTLDRELTLSLSKLSQQAGATLFMTLLAALNTLLYRYTGSEDIVIGAPIASRDRSEIAGLIGLFANTLALRTDLAGNPSWLELLARVQHIAVGAYSHQDLPFDLLVEKLQPQRDLSYSPLFQVMFSFAEDVAARQLNLRNLVCHDYPLNRHTAQFDLTLRLEKQADGLVGRWEYNSDLFDVQTIERFVGHFQTLLAGIVANPQQPISQLPLLTATEQQQILCEWNDTQAPYPEDQCVHQLFETQVKLTPDRVAVGCDRQQLTYQELNNRANQLARQLQTVGVTTGVLVGICVDRSLDLVVGLLGILKAGGAYVPLDPTYPQARLAEMIADSQLAVLVTQQDLECRLPDHSAQVVCLDRDWQEISRLVATNLDCDVTAADLAYIIYTSGSTGRPKGVQIGHRSIVNFLTSMRKRPGLLASDILLSVTTISFDIAVLELYLPLIVGAKVVLVSRELAMDGRGLLELLTTTGANVMQATPATWQLLIAAGWQGKSSLKILCGGEALAPDLARQLVDRGGSVWNMYGPTEATVWATIAEVNGATLGNRRQPVSIGKSIDNIQTYILDRHLQPVPIGIAGELYLGGVGLAVGYLHRPELTAEKFIPDPFNPTPAARLYQTGDLVKYLPTGEIEYISRLDHQVKLRGFRIELGEIDTVLATYPDLRAAVTIVREDLPGDKRLIAYVVLDRSPTEIGKSLTDFLADKLPKHLIPETFVTLAALPLTPNGKIDRRALPAPTDLRSTSAKTFVAPQDQLEVELTQIWERVLQVKPIGINDNFFELGGHSLLAVYLFNEIERVWHQRLPLAALFQAQTIAKLADLVRQSPPESTWSSLVPIQLGTNHKPPLFCIHPAGGNILEYYPLAHHLGVEQPIYGLQSQGLDGRQPLLSRVEDMASHYIAEMLTVQPDGPYFLLGYSFGGLIAYEIARQLQARSKPVAFLAIIDRSSPQLNKVRPSWAKSMQIHLSNLWQLKAQERWKYITDRFDYRFKRVDYKEFLIRGVSEFATITPALLNLIDANSQAEQDYVGQPYPGDLILFRPQVQTLENYLYPDFGWGELVAGKVEIHNIASSHYGVLKEPSVRLVATQLQLCLQKTRSQIAISGN